MLADQVASFSRNERVKLEAMHGIKRIGAKILDALLKGNLPEFGRLLGEHFDLKRGLSDRVLNARLDGWCELTLHHRALGGKLMGAGGGEFLLVYYEQSRQPQVPRALEHEGLRHVPFQFDFSGTQLIDRWPTEL